MFFQAATAGAIAGTHGTFGRRWPSRRNPWQQHYMLLIQPQAGFQCAAHACARPGRVLDALPGREAFAASSYRGVQGCCADRTLLHTGRRQLTWRQFYIDSLHLISAWPSQEDDKPLSEMFPTCEAGLFSSSWSRG